MSFAIPRNVPRFEDSQRALENVYWSHTAGGGKDLPMYKDKPYNYPYSSRRRSLWKRKRFLGALGIILIVFYFFFGGSEKTPPRLSKLLRKSKSGADWEDRANDVKKAFELSWDRYSHYAWG
jgi:endoplasmic reticulum Man9GlcNAc2 1,2-alpha-mannosidase